MLSVDLAFDSFIKRVGLNALVDYFSSDTNYTIKTKGKEITWHKLDDVKQLYKYDRIIYWGDFLQWIGFGNNDWLNRQKEELKLNGMDKYFRLFLLDKNEDLYKNTILFGGSIYPLSSNDLLDKRYNDGLHQLINASKLTLFRDIASAGFAQQLSNKENQFWGCDCAFLLDTAPVMPTAKKTLVYSFGRSGNKEAQTQFALEFAARLNLDAIDVQWFSQKIDLFSKIYMVKQASVVLTDIYHLSVTGLREQIPTLCIGQGSSYATSTVADKKKEILFKQHFAEHYYIFLLEVMTSSNNKQERTKLIERCAELVASKDELTIISALLDKHVERTSNRLYNALLEG